MIMPRFLQTITVLGYELIIPIDRIIYIAEGYEGGEEDRYFIKIISDDNGSAIEYFEEEECFENRLEIIKSIIGTA